MFNFLVELELPVCLEGRFAQMARESDDSLTDRLMPNHIGMSVEGFLTFRTSFRLGCGHS